MTEGQIEVLFDHPDRVWDIAYNDEESREEDDEGEDGEGEGEGEGDDDDDDDDDDDEKPLATLLGEPLLEELWLEKSWDVLRFLLRKAAGRQPADIHDLGDPSSELLWGETVGDEPAD